ncbi:MAG: ABC transporter permease [Anaerolineaceae bacterium]
MHNIWIIGRREYSTFFTSVTAYAVALMIFISLGIIFYANVVAAQLQQIAPGIQIVLSPLITILLFSTPGITMKSFSEEQKSGTLELLMTAPLRDWELVIGKWFGSFLFLMTIALATLIFPAILNLLISPGLDVGLLVSNYIGLALFISSIAAVGIAASSFFSNQVASFFAALGLLLALWMLSFPAQAAGSASGSILQYLSITEHFFDTFYKGIVELKDVVYYLSLTILALFIGYVSIDSRRWR